MGEEAYVLDGWKKMGEWDRATIIFALFTIIFVVVLYLLEF